MLVATAEMRPERAVGDDRPYPGAYRAPRSRFHSIQRDKGVARPVAYHGGPSD